MKLLSLIIMIINLFHYNHIALFRWQIVPRQIVDLLEYCLALKSNIPIEKVSSMRYFTFQIYNGGTDTTSRS